jgi:hypothetical protein
MADPLAIVILIAAGESRDMTSAASAAIRRTLGADTRVEVRESAEAPNDSDALSVEKQSRADAVIELTWTDPERRMAAIRAHDAKAGKWITRWVGFASVDPGSDADVGRTVGFAAASMLPEAPLEGEPPLGAGPSPSRPPPSTPAEPAPAQESRNLPAPAFRPQFALDWLALAVKDIDGEASGVGPAIALHLFVARPVSLRAGVGARWGEVAGAQASVLTVVPSAGAVVHALRATRAQRFGVSARLDCLLAYESLTRSTPDALGQVSRTRWLSGFDAFVDGSWLVSSGFEAVAGLGLEYVLGATHVDLQSSAQTRIVATLAPLHAGAELGFRWGL